MEHVRSNKDVIAISRMPSFFYYCIYTSTTEFKLRIKGMEYVRSNKDVIAISRMPSFFYYCIYILKIKQPLHQGPRRRPNYNQVLGPDKDYINM
jgi:hypothetical protein